jgi:hypothetical protein
LAKSKLLPVADVESLAHIKQLCHLQCLFLCFEAVSGLKINLAKSKLLPVADVESLAHIVGCRVTSLLMKYLSLPLGASYKATSIWEWHD